MTESPSLRPEEKLEAIIQKQVDGGCTWNKKLTTGEFILSDYLVVITLRQFKTEEGMNHAHADPHLRQFHILECLLDIEGLKAAYGTEHVEVIRAPLKSGKFFVRLDEAWASAGHKILDSWFTDGANSAIDTAFSLLPS